MDWKCIDRFVPQGKTFLERFPTVEHPLKAAPSSNFTTNLVTNKRTSKTTADLAAIHNIIPNPLSSVNFDGNDPLNKFAQLAEDDSPEVARPTVPVASTKYGKTATNQFGYERWNNRKAAILNRYTTSEKLSITTSFLAGGEVIKSTTTVTDKVKHRLEQLDNFDDDPVRQMQNLTQHEYVVKIEQLNYQLRDAWNSDQRVKALKIAIQCAKLLADTSAMQFYPSKFVLITDVLDLFGNLVFDRLKSKSEIVRMEEVSQLPDEFTPDMVPETTKETCLNWFYKVASIRELLPRFYVEACIVKSYQFLGSRDVIDGALNRLTLIARGIGDPLVAAYARCYLCRVGMTVSDDKIYLHQNFDDLLSMYHTVSLLFLQLDLVLTGEYQLFLGSVRSEISRQRLSLQTYVVLYSPAFEWVLHGIVTNADEYKLDELVLKCQERKHCAPLFNAILNSFPRKFIAFRALHFVNILSKCDTETYTRSEMLRCLGLCLSSAPPPPDQMFDVFEYVWRCICTFSQSDEYLQCIEAWVIFVAKYLTLNEVNTILKDIVKRSSNSKNAFENEQRELQNTIERFVNNVSTLHSLLKLKAFLPVIDLFQKEQTRVEVCRKIMERLRDTESSISDLVIINAVMHVSKILNDSVNALTVDDERRQISEFVITFIRIVDFDDDFEQRLQFCVDARAAFTNLEAVYVILVHMVNQLVVDTWRQLENGSHTKKSSDFVKACIAYNFVTIPSIVQVPVKLDLYLLTGQVALLNGCLGQADGLFEAAIQLVPEMPRQIEYDGKQRPAELYLLPYLQKFLTTLIVLPDSPDQGVLYILRCLIEAVQTFELENVSNLVTFYLDILEVLNVMAQVNYPFHIPNVISNDELYGHDPKFINHINNLCTQMCSNVLVNLKLLADKGEYKEQAQFALILFSIIVSSSDITDERTWQLSVNLFNLAAKQRAHIEQKLFITEIEKVDALVVACKSTDDRRTKLEELLNKMKIKILG